MVIIPFPKKRYSRTVERLRKPGRGFFTHGDEISSVKRQLAAKLKIKNPNKHQIYRLYNKLGNIFLEKSLFESHNTSDKMRLLREAKSSYEHAKNYCRNNLFQTNTLDKTIKKVNNTILDMRPRLYRIASLLVISVVFLISTLVFFSLSMTGAVTGTARSDLSFLGVVFFIAALVIAFVYFRTERKKFEKLGLL